jgi:Tfp pilus assembly protein PilP
MKPTNTILICVLASGLAAAQSPSVIQNTRTTMDAVQKNAAAASNAALGVQGKASTAGATHASRPATSGSAKPSLIGTNATIDKTVVSHTGAGKSVRVATAGKPATTKVAATADKNKKKTPAATTVASTAAAETSGDKPAADDQAAPENKWTGKRDPFISPVVSRATGTTACSTGKKCLEIGTINLRGIVHAENGFIAVVSNSLNKAYFLRENDPVFNGYVVKITGDSIVFQETLQDRLGKTFTREVTKKITIPAV